MQHTYAVIGSPILHSVSPLIHQQFADQFKLALNFKRLEITPNLLAGFMQQLRLGQIRGASVTAPLKESILQYIDILSPEAKIAGAINTISLCEDGAVKGDNTDGCGLVRDLTVRHGISVKSKNILIFGAGGAVRGILSALLYLQPNQICLVNRNIDKARKLADRFNSAIAVKQYNELGAGDYDLLINATSAALQGEHIPIDNNNIFKDTVCYDLNYGTKAQQFLRLALDNGASKTIDGFGMLLEQAAEAFFIWHNLQPNTELIMQKLHPTPDHIPVIYGL